MSCLVTAECGEVMLGCALRRSQCYVVPVSLSDQHGRRSRSLEHVAIGMVEGVVWPETRVRGEVTLSAMQEQESARVPAIPPAQTWNWSVN